MYSETAQTPKYIKWEKSTRCVILDKASFLSMSAMENVCVCLHKITPVHSGSWWHLIEPCANKGYIFKDCQSKGGRIETPCTHLCSVRSIWDYPCGHQHGLYQWGLLQLSDLHFLLLLSWNGVTWLSIEIWSWSSIANSYPDCPAMFE